MKLLTKILAFCVFAIAPINAFSFTSGKSGFSVKIDNQKVDYSVFAIFVLPQQVAKISLIDTSFNDQFEIKADQGVIQKTGKASWSWKAPDKNGHYPLEIIRKSTQETMVINAFVMIPYKELKGEYLNGYRIGKYPLIPLKNLPIYNFPKGFIEVNQQTEDVLISPHFKLKEFLCKQESDYPKYLVINKKLLFKLELILQKLNDKGYQCESFHIMSGYRTPFYNHAIGNVKYSRHVWGGASDIFIDENPKDGMMDDLNQDNVINYRDAEIIYDIIDEMYGQAWYEPFMGGLGLYKKTKSHGPFVHVDVRGFRARWGD